MAPDQSWPGQTTELPVAAAHISCCWPSSGQLAAGAGQSVQTPAGAHTMGRSGTTLSGTSVMTPSETPVFIQVYLNKITRDTCPEIRGKIHLLEAQRRAVLLYPGKSPLRKNKEE